MCQRNRRRCLENYGGATPLLRHTVQETTAKREGTHKRCEIKSVCFLRC